MALACLLASSGSVHWLSYTISIDYINSRRYKCRYMSDYAFEILVRIVFIVSGEQIVTRHDGHSRPRGGVSVKRSDRRETLGSWIGTDSL